MAYDFKKLSEVETLSEIPGNTNVLAEVGGEIKRVPGGGLGDKKTVYDYAKEGGYTGTEDEFVKGLVKIPDVTNAVENLPLENSVQRIYSSDLYRPSNCRIDFANINIGYRILNSDNILLGGDACDFADYRTVKKGMVLELPDGLTSIYSPEQGGLIVCDDSGVVIDKVDAETLLAKRNYIFENDGIMYLAMADGGIRGVYYSLTVKNLVQTVSNIENRVVNLEMVKPLILYAEKVEEYKTDSSIGDETLKAILTGRPILVRVPNADGGNFTAIYSPILMYQLPNVDNNYLYLFYLRDEKQDLSSLGLTGVQLPTYGELKMLLSETYTETPLT